MSDLTREVTKEASEWCATYIEKRLTGKGYAKVQNGATTVKVRVGEEVRPDMGKKGRVASQ